MRRKTPGVLAARELAPKRLRELSRDDIRRFIGVLEPLVLERRRERLRAVIAARLGSVQVVFDAPYNPHNGAAVVRSCEAFGVQTLHVAERKGVSFLVAGTVSRGAEKWLDVMVHQEVGSVLEAAERAKMSSSRPIPKASSCPRTSRASRASPWSSAMNATASARSSREPVRARCGCPCAASWRA